MIAMMSKAQENARRANVERRWPRYQWDGSGRSRWAGWDWRNYLYIILCALLLSATILEVALTKDGEKEPWWPFGLLAESTTGLVILTLLIFGNGWLMDRTLADRTPGKDLVPVWLRWLRRALVSLPIMGLYTIPVWRWIVQTKPSWAFRTSIQPAFDLSATSETIAGAHSRFRGWQSTLRRSQGQSFFALFLWMTAGQIAPWIALLSWVTTADTLSPKHQTLLSALSTLCHVLACALGLQYGLIRGSQTRAVRWKAVAIRFAPLSFLFPFPFFVIGLLLWMIWAGEETETFVGRSHSNKLRPPEYIPLAKGSSIGRFIRLLTRGKRELDVILNDLLPGTLQNSEVQEHQFAFYRLKTFLLLFDAAALAWVLTRLGGRPVLRMDIIPWRQIAPFLCLAILGIMIELCFLVLRVVGWFLRRSLPYQPYGHSVTVTQLAFTAGLFFGTLLATGQGPVAGHLLVVIGLGAVIGSTLISAPISFVLLLPGRQTFVTLAWSGLFFELIVTGAVMYYQPELAPPFTSFFKAAIDLAPVWSLALFLGLSGWLLHPFKLGHLFDRRLPSRTRAALATVALTAALPLGGLAIPFWIYAHHRLWPKYEKLLWNLKGTSMDRP
jgi:hypothetical protein